MDRSHIEQMKNQIRSAYEAKIHRLKEEMKAVLASLARAEDSIFSEAVDLSKLLHTGPSETGSRLSMEGRPTAAERVRRAVAKIDLLPLVFPSLAPSGSSGPALWGS